MKYLAIIGAFALATAHAEAPVPARLPSDGIYTQTPSGQDFARYFPARALAENKDGRVTLDCIVQTDQSLKCAVTSETPAEYGFGAATLSIANAFRVVAVHEGAPTAGKRVLLPIFWRVQ